MNLNYNAGFKPIRGMVMTPPDLARAKNDAFCEQNNLFTVNKIFCGRCGVKNACQTWQNMQSASRALAKH